MTSIMEKATKAIVECHKIPLLTKARFEGQLQDKVAMVKTTWSHTASVSGSKVSFNRFDTISLDTNKVISRSMPSVCSEGISAFNPQKNVEVQITKKQANQKGSSEDEFILEVWKGDGVCQTINLSDFGAHGPVYFDDQFGSLALDPSGSKVAFIAEENRPKSQAFTKGFGATYKKLETEVKGKPKGMEYEYVEDWGEQLVGKSQTVIVTFDLNTREIHVWSRPCKYEEGKDEKNLHEVLPEDSCVGQLAWGADGKRLFGVATPTSPRRLGNIYCTNRPAHIFMLNLSNEKFSVVSNNTGKVNCQRPKLIQGDAENLLLWFERDLGMGGVYPGTHLACTRLMKLALDGEKCGSPKVVVDIVKKFDVEEESFPGFYVASFPSGNCVLPSAKGQWVVINSIVTHYSVPVACNLETGQVLVLDDLKNTKILSIANEAIEDRSVVVGTKSVPDEVPKVFVGSLKQKGNDFKVDFTTIGGHESDKIIKDLDLDISWKSLLTRPPGSPFKLGSFYVGPKCSSDKSKIPLLVWIHGGPNSVFPSDFKHEQLFFLKMGYGVLAVNYRGSLGHGSDCETSLLGRIGDFDVKDCVQIVKQCLDEVKGLDGTRVFLFGGSHGGFLVTQLAGQYPDMFKAVVCRNPALDLPSMALTSDIPDWVINQGQGKSYSSDSYLSMESYKELHENSSTRHAANIKIPIFFMVGLDDVRVPPSQGIEMYRRLKAMGKKVRLNVYEDNHPLAKVPVTTDVMINAAMFFDEVGSQ